MLLDERAPAPTTPQAHPEESAPFTRYEHPVDRTRAGAENTPGGVTFVPLVFHPSFSPNRRITKAEKREALIKQAALRIVAGLEDRSLRDLAEEIDCGHTAIHNAVQRFCIRLGLRPVRVSDATRAKMREARRRQLAMRSS